MKFNFALFNHSKTGLATYYDIVNAIAGQLWDLGHEVYRDDLNFHDECVNIMFEGFHKQINEWLLPQCTARGVKVICIQTEQHGKKAFNNKSYVKELVDRQRLYPAGVKQCVGALTLVPGEQKWTRLYNPRAIDLELGWSQFRENMAQRKNTTPVYDFCFYGGYTPRRKQIFQQLEKKGYIIAYAPEYGEDLIARDNLIASSKVVIGPKPHPGWNLVSGSRWATALTIGRPGITEPHTGQSTWKQIIRFSKGYDSFIEECEEVLANWEKEYEKQYQAFKTLLSPTSEKCIEQALKFILGESYEQGSFKQTFEQLNRRNKAVNEQGNTHT